MEILLIEDEQELAAGIREGLEAARFRVEHAADGEAGLRRALEHEFDAIVLDLMLPRLDGWQVCERLRLRRCSTPILMLTARGDLQDRIRGLESGADDYLPKPFEFGELRARLRALIRRSSAHKGQVIRIADLEIDTRNQRVCRGGKEVPLTGREYTLLEALARREGEVLTRPYILERVWKDEESYSNTISVHMRSLRSKVDSGEGPKLIHTVYGQGYFIRTPAEGVGEVGMRSDGGKE